MTSLGLGGRGGKRSMITDRGGIGNDGNILVITRMYVYDLSEIMKLKSYLEYQRLVAFLVVLHEWPAVEGSVVAVDVVLIYASFVSICHVYITATYECKVAVVQVAVEDELLWW